MELTGDEIIEKYGKSCGHCNRNTLLPNEFDFTCIVCGYNVTNESMSSQKYKEKK